jgi:hypothetical protein
MARSAAAYKAGKSTKKVLSHYDEIEERSSSLVLGEGGQLAGSMERADGQEEAKGEDVAFQSLVIS